MKFLGTRVDMQWIEAPILICRKQASAFCSGGRTSHVSFVRRFFSAFPASILHEMAAYSEKITEHGFADSVFPFHRCVLDVVPTRAWMQKASELPGLFNRVDNRGSEAFFMRFIYRCTPLGGGGLMVEGRDG